MSESNSDLRGAPKKEAFHQEAEAKIVNFAFKPPAEPIPFGKKAHIKLAGTNSCRASVQILNRGGENNLHYHPNLDLIYMVLKGRVQFFGPEGKMLGDYGPNEGLLLPENSRYWFKSEGDEEAWLLQIAGYPKGAEMSKRVPVEPARPDAGGVWFGLTEREQEIRQRNNKL